MTKSTKAELVLLSFQWNGQRQWEQLRASFASVIKLTEQNQNKVVLLNVCQVYFPMSYLTTIAWAPRGFGEIGQKWKSYTLKRAFSQNSDFINFKTCKGHSWSTH